MMHLYKYSYFGLSSASISSNFSMISMINVDCDITLDLLFVTLVDNGVGRRTVKQNLTG